MELLKLLHQIKSHIRTQWLIPLNILNESETGTDLTKFDNQRRLDEWQHVALVLDRLFFILFSIAMPCTALIFVSAHASAKHGVYSNFTNFKIDAKCDHYPPKLT